MKRSAAIITATLAALAFSGCSTIRQYHLTPENDGGESPTTTVLEIADPQLPQLPRDTGKSPLAAAPVCDGTSTTNCPITPGTLPPCDAIQYGVCLPNGCGGVADCGPPPSGGQADNSDCSPEGFEVGACHTP